MMNLLIKKKASEWQQCHHCHHECFMAISTSQFHAHVTTAYDARTQPLVWEESCQQEGVEGVKEEDAGTNVSCLSLFHLCNWCSSSVILFLNPELLTCSWMHLRTKEDSICIFVCPDSYTVCGLMYVVAKNFVTIPVTWSLIWTNLLSLC